MHVINMNVKDTPEEAILGGKDCLLLCKLIEGGGDLEENMPLIIQQAEEKINKSLMYSLHYL